MSQHSDILTWEICKGIEDGVHATDISNRIQGLLDVLEYDEHFTDMKNVKKHVYGHAKWMMTQKDGLYGRATHAKLDKFLTELWCANQWLSD
jgi:hypothetical protein